MEEHDFRSSRHYLVDNHVAGRGVRAPRVLEAIRWVPREAFVPEPLREFTYEDTALAGANGSTIAHIAQPRVVALMVQALGLQGGEKVLEIGTGPGDTTAVLARIAHQVFGVEPDTRLAAKATASLGGAGCARRRTGDSRSKQTHFRAGNCAAMDYVSCSPAA